ncbi:hypothetical protein [Nonomuraea sp. NPDC003804]|uniref:hypothetical protein n=1 Tax=Nonomuraea sp. NPDC003804 TaxID=3154547 RepID=UPI0033A4B2E8
MTKTNLAPRRTPAWLMALEMLVLGAGIGCAIQLLVLIMQNSAEPQSLGVASAAAMFFRSMGGALGTALFGTILVRRLTYELQQQAPALPGSAEEIARQAMSEGAALSPALQTTVSQAVADSIHVVYLWALPFAGLFLILALALPSVPLWTVDFLRKVRQDHEAQLATTAPRATTD